MKKLATTIIISALALSGAWAVAWSPHLGIWAGPVMAFNLTREDECADMRTSLSLNASASAASITFAERHTLSLDFTAAIVSDSQVKNNTVLLGSTRLGLSLGYDWMATGIYSIGLGADISYALVPGINAAYVCVGGNIRHAVHFGYGISLENRISAMYRREYVEAQVSVGMRWAPDFTGGAK